MDYLDVATCNFNENYLVYSDGSLYNGNAEKFRNRSDNGPKSPYFWYSIPDGKGKHKKHYVHRLVATHFLDNPELLRDVHHKDSNPSNNDVSNLEWMSHKDNCALSHVPLPTDIIKKRPLAYTYRIKNNQYRFSYTGHRHQNIPMISKYFRSREEAIEYRDYYFLTQSVVA
tara:strand:- start:2026 stop:2538 length:513 start_codon:yes stop_codon:yes gene_type:complete